MANGILDTLSPLLVNLLFAALALLAAMALRGINSFTEWLRCESESLANDDWRHLVNDALERIDTLAEVTVTCIEQTAAGTIREALKNGVEGITRDELLALGKEACETVIGNLSDEYKDALADACIDLESYVKSVVESKVYELKHSPSLLLEGAV